MHAYLAYKEKDREIDRGWNEVAFKRAERVPPRR